MRQSANGIADDQRVMNNNFLKLRRSVDASMRGKVSLAPDEHGIHHSVKAAVVARRTAELIGSGHSQQLEGSPGGVAVQRKKRANDGNIVVSRRGLLAEALFQIVREPFRRRR